MDYQEFIEAIYEPINKGIFDDELPQPFLLAERVGTSHDGEVLGMFLTGENSPYSDKPTIIINPYKHWDLLDDDAGLTDYFLFMTDTLAHEMIHYYCHLHGITDTKDDGTHTDEFMDACKSHWIECGDGDQGKNLTSIGIGGWNGFSNYADPDILELLEMA